MYYFCLCAGFLHFVYAHLGLYYLFVRTYGSFASLSSLCDALTSYPPVVGVDLINDYNRGFRVFAKNIDK